MRKGFTLLELLIVVIIVGILAAYAIPQYIKSTERAKLGKAKHALSLIAEAEKMYRADNDVYVNVNDGQFDAKLGNYVEMGQIDSDNDWDYKVGDATPSAFTATATRKDGPNANETVTLDQDGNLGGNFIP